MMKLLRVERFIVVYLTEGEKRADTIDFDITVEEIRLIVTANDDDPLYYDGYILSEEQLQSIFALKDIEIQIDLSKYYYVLECGGIYE